MVYVTRFSSILYHRISEITLLFRGETGLKEDRFERSQVRGAFQERERRPIKIYGAPFHVLIIFI